MMAAFALTGSADVFASVAPSPAIALIFGVQGKSFSACQNCSRLGCGALPIVARGGYEKRTGGALPMIATAWRYFTIRRTSDASISDRPTSEVRSLPNFVAARTATDVDCQSAAWPIGLLA